MTSYAALLRPTHWQPPGGVWLDEYWPAHRDAMKRAHDLCQTYTRLYTRTGSRAHLSPPIGARGVLCAVLPMWPDDWLGTGSQDEYEWAAELPTCKRCEALFMLGQRCGNPQCPCQNRDGSLGAALAAAAAKASGPPKSPAPR